MSSTRVCRPIRTYTHRLTERKAATSLIPYGCYKYEAAKNYLPGGLFHFVRDTESYVPTLHGLDADFIRNLKEVGVCAVNSAIANRPFLNTPHLYEVELINTGHESMKMGDRFTVQLPDRQDVAAQLEVENDPGYNLHVNFGIWGGLLATRRVNCETGGDAVEEAIQVIKNDSDFDVFQLVSPYTPQCTLSMLTLVANGAHYDKVSLVNRTLAAAAINEDFNADTVNVIFEEQCVKDYLKYLARHVLNMVESVQGFATGQVVRSCNGYNYSEIKTGDRFAAQLNMNRWLS